MKRGRNPETPYITEVKPLVAGDLQYLREKSDRGQSPVKVVRDSHHQMARMFASGLSNNEIAAKCGYSATRVSLLKNSPAMQELIAHYRGIETEVWQKNRDTYHESLHAAGAKALRMINEQLDEAEEKSEHIPLGTLLKIADTASDRIGYGKRQTNINVNIDFAKKLEEAIKRSRLVNMIDVTPLPAE